MEQRPKKVLEQVQDVIILKQYSCQMEKTYINWIKPYIFPELCVKQTTCMSDRCWYNGTISRQAIAPKSKLKYHNIIQFNSF